MTYSSELAKGIAAFEKGDFDGARGIFNKIIETRRGSLELQEAQWYLARIAEEQGRFNEARHQYTLFSKNFPSSSHITEVKDRLAALSSLRDRPTQPIQPRPVVKQRETISLYGRLSGYLTTEYLYDNLTSPSPSITTQNRLTEFLDMRWKKRTGADMRVYASSFYSYGFLDQEDPRSRISKLFAEWNNLKSMVDLRLGRQPASGNTLFSRFDGSAFAYRPFNSINLNAGAGYPVHLSNTNKPEIQSDHWFYDAYLSLYDFYRLGGKIYYTEEFKDGLSARNAVGVNGYWIKDTVNVTALLDYDLDFKKFNDELIGLEYTHSNVRYSGAFEYRRSPFLDYETALLDPTLVGTNINSLGTLRQTRSRDQIQSLTLANTSHLLDFRFGTTIDFSKVWRGDFKYAHTLSEVVDFAVGRARKTADRFSIFFTERNGLSFSETWTLLLLYQPATDSQTATAVTTLSKYWNNGALVSVKIRLEWIDFKTSGAQTNRLAPGLSFILPLRGGTELNFEGDYVIEDTNVSPDTLTTIQTRTSITIKF